MATCKFVPQATPTFQIELHYICCRAIVIFCVVIKAWVLFARHLELIEGFFRQRYFRNLLKHIILKAVSICYSRVQAGNADRPIRSCIQLHVEATRVKIIRQ